MRSLVLVLIGLAAVMAWHHDHHAIVTEENIAKLKSVASFEVADYESHPFKNWSIEDVRSRLGLMRSEEKPRREILYGDNGDLPETFDAREQWPDCVHKIRDQQQCGSCWAFAASEVLSDRFCIASKGAINVVLSPQDLVSCDSNDYGCNGGYLDKSWEYIQETGIVTDECLPYTSGRGDSGVCPFSDELNKNKCKKGTFKKYHAQSIGQHSTIAEAKSAIFNNGPIEAGFDVYEDFLSYIGGVYKRTSNNLLGGHAVKVVGWGKDTDGTEYWIVANSWNTSWGENGFFRIAFGECNFESELWSGIPLIKEYYHHLH